ncbi:prevent-host-death family protein, partial [Vibrio cholerae]
MEFIMSRIHLDQDIQPLS